MQHRLEQYYLNLHRLRLVMAKNGVTRPNGTALEFYERIVTALEGVDSSAPIKLETYDGVASFTDEELKGTRSVRRTKVPACFVQRVLR